MPVAMPSLPGFQVFRDEMSLFKVIGMALLFYYCVMDVILYITFMNTNLVESSKGASDDELYSPFTYVYELTPPFTLSYFAYLVISSCSP